MLFIPLKLAFAIANKPWCSTASFFFFFFKILIILSFKLCSLAECLSRAGGWWAVWHHKWCCSGDTGWCWWLTLPRAVPHWGHAQGMPPAAWARDWWIHKKKLPLSSLSKIKPEQSVQLKLLDMGIKQGKLHPHGKTVVRKEQKSISTLNHSEIMISISMHPPWSHVSLMFMKLKIRS